MIWPFSQPKEPTVAAYLASKPSQRREAKEIRELPIVLLDAETTGFKIGVDRLLTLGIIRVQAQQILVESARSWTVYQEKPILNEAVKVHGILPSDTNNGRPEKEVMLEFLSELQDAIIVGHHIGFDTAVLNEASKRHFRISIKNRVVDTAHLAMQELTAFKRTGYVNQRPPTLEELCTHLKMPILERHTALGDAYTTGLLFLNLCARISRRLGRPVQLRDLPR
ncbi:3'-5' exonuclease [Pelagicoccus sp. NFK12]|uniref:3'-5' exonuclease n=1 Tax=Pelagicoccus enzymogenes TaxID=2773457 RepID=A0A927IK48_9BACT|nr:3'-5' exonuclease [Pelagicoccus enzymogenes]MBD5782235.1 3'-5' exonuclease [Pelagicoccus enzymogenes]MDQ8198746.1 3'-5' exonuclease [Pelagicoccus enzymogenes]